MASPVEILLHDPLTEVTRKERRILLGACAIAFTIARTELVPSKISALGVEFTAGDQKSLFSIMALFITYFLWAFLTYAISDFVAWRVAYYSAVSELAKYMKEGSGIGSLRIKKSPFERKSIVWGGISRPVSILRALLDFAVPVAVGIATIVLLLRTEVPAKAVDILLQPPVGTEHSSDLDAKRPLVADPQPR